MDAKELKFAVMAALGNPLYRPTITDAKQANAFDSIAEQLGMPNKAWRGSPPTKPTGAEGKAHRFAALKQRNAARVAP